MVRFSFLLWIAVIHHQWTDGHVNGLVVRSPFDSAVARPGTSPPRPVSSRVNAVILEGDEHRHVDVLFALPPPTHDVDLTPADAATWCSSTVTIADTTGGPVVASSADLLLLSPPDLTPPFLVAAVALVLLVAAQTFINQMLEGDRGLGAFLRDGSGYRKSGFRAKTARDDDGGGRQRRPSDPLPWLSLPRLDYVDVAGQPTLAEQDESETAPAAAAAVYQQLEQLRLRMNREVQEENYEEASRLRNELEKLMKDQGIEFTTKDTTR